MSVLNRLASVSALILVSAVVSIPTTTAAQEPAASGAPRTPWGHPDLQGVWDFRSATPLERSADVGDRAQLTDAEAAEYLRTAPQRARSFITAVAGDVDVGEELWNDTGSLLAAGNRTSLVIDPPDGTVPRNDANRQRLFPVLQQIFAGRPGSYEERGLSERCIMWTHTPLLPTFSNNNVQIFQTSDAVIMLHEMVHDIRVIFLDDRPLLSDGLRQLRGSSRGHWDGDTLVVESTGFRHGMHFLSTGPNMQLVERLTRTGAETIDYQYTINDPEWFTRPWSVSLPLRRTELPIYEYACHEGNRSMTLMLESARRQDLDVGRASGGSDARDEASTAGDIGSGGKD